MAYSFVYVTGVTLDEIRDAQRHIKDAHDPLNYFMFSRSITRNYQTLSYTDDDRIVFAEKGGADASHFIKDLEDRLHAVGLPEAHVQAHKPEQGRGTALGFYFAGMSKDQVNAVRARLNELAADLGYRAAGGPTVGQGNAAGLLVALAQGHMVVQRRADAPETGHASQS